MDSYLGQNIRWILNEFSKNNVSYVVLRNYEDLPEIGHDLDLVADKNDFNLIKKIFKECKNKFQWDEYLEIKLWESYTEDFTISVFKFFNYNKKSCLHIDFFGGYSIWSAPAFSVKDIIKERIFENFYYKVNPKHEIIIRSMQLACAIRDNEIERTVKLKKILKRLENETDIDNAFNELPIKISNEYYYKEGKDFFKSFDKFKKTYTKRFFLKKPFNIILRFIERVRFRLKLYTYAIPGVLIFINSNSYRENKQKINNELNLLDDSKIINDFEILESLHKSKIINSYKKLLKGGVIMICIPFLRRKFYEGLIKNKIIKRYTK